MQRVKNSGIETIIHSKLKMLEIQRVFTTKRMADVSQNHNLVPLSKLQLWAKITNLQSSAQKLDYISAQIGNNNDYKILNLLVQDRYINLSFEEIDVELNS